MKLELIPRLVVQFAALFDDCAQILERYLGRTSFQGLRLVGTRLPADKVDNLKCGRYALLAGLGVHLLVDGTGRQHRLPTEMGRPIERRIVLGHALEIPHQLKHAGIANDQLVGVDGEHGEAGAI